MGNNSGTLQFNRVGAIATGNYTMTICYLNGDAERYGLLSVNGSQGTPVTFRPPGRFTLSGQYQVTVILNAGSNTLEFYNPIVGSWAPDFDRISFNCASCALPTPTATATATPTSTPTPTPTPTPEGCYPNFTTPEGCQALNSLTTGSANAGLGWRALFANSDGSFNTAVGGGALVLGNGSSNTAVGAAALLLNTSGTQNTAVGVDALVFNDSGGPNTAIGYSALMNNGTGGPNTAIGWQALIANVDGFNNVALGAFPISKTNTSGNDNTAIGYMALENSATTSGHVAVGSEAGSGITTGPDPFIPIDNNVIIGHLSGLHSVFGLVPDRCFIDNIYGAPVSGATAFVVVVDSDGRLGTVTANGADAGGFSPKGISPKAIPGAAREALFDIEVQKLEETIGQQRNQLETLIAQLKEQNTGKYRG